MPNYKFSQRISEYTERRLRALCDLHNDVVESDFPLTQPQIEAAVAPAQVRELISKLRGLNITSVNQSAHICAIVGGEGIERPALVSIIVRPQVYFCYTEQARPAPSLAYAVKTKLPFDISALDEASRKKLIVWVNRAVRERRRTKLVKRVVFEFLRSPLLCDSAYMLLARWPTLALLFRGDHDWEARLREYPNNLNRWRWKGSEAEAWHDKNKRAMAIADQLLLGANLVKPINRDRLLITAQVSDWEKLNGESI